MLAAEFSNDRFWPGLFGPPLGNARFTSRSLRSNSSFRLAQFLLTGRAARNHGHRFVTTVLALN